MRLFNTVADLRHYLDKNVNQTVGLVPTMGALHAGHLSLIEQARKDCQIVVVSIFVNPLQFGPNEDLARYPRPKEEDTTLCQQAGVDVIFMPPSVELYGIAKPALETFTQIMPPKGMTALLCGRARPTHFQGVATVVTKLLNIVRPTFAYFGQKDAQQVAIIKRLVNDLNLPGTVLVCPIVREPDGLALSSRNRYLTEPQRIQATVLNRSLQAVKAAFAQGETSEQALRSAALQVLSTEPDVVLDYLTLVHPDTLKPLQTVTTVGMMAIAAHVGKARLLDNVILSNLERTPIIAIDGPAGAGKSTVARQIAHHLGLLYLDTGAMYRALTWFVLQQKTNPTDEAAVTQLLPHCHIQLVARVDNDQPQPPKVDVNGKDVTAAIRTPEVTAQVSTIAAQAAVRAHLVQQQQQYGMQGGVVADGRDIGTHVFPDAELKIFLTASVEERAQRRYLDLKEARLSPSGVPLPAIEELTAAIAERDRKDSTRSVSPLKKAPDAIEIVTDHLSAEQVIEKIILLYRQLTA
ncbi:MAG: bifunctional pantoate--beta-alanine ligase/(d)CMP kinase [Cyanobacteria bacterium P01_D01_bin.105]